MSEAKLNHAMTAALIQLEGEACAESATAVGYRNVSTPPGGPTTTSAKMADKKSPFRVITTLDKMNILPSDPNFIRDNQSLVVQTGRMPEPKPLRLAATKRKQSHAGVPTDRLNQQKFGVMDISPTNAVLQLLEQDQSSQVGDYGNKNFV